MYTKNFEADTMELALKDIKNELGPDAIILKTTMNKGVKGVLSKGKRVQITAAISEKSYSNKMKVDRVLDENQKQKFYQGESGKISQQINSYANQGNANPYSGHGLNTPPRTTKTKTDSLDDFLESSPKVEKVLPTEMVNVSKAENIQVNPANYESNPEVAELKRKLAMLENRVNSTPSPAMQINEETDEFSHAKKRLLSYGLENSICRKLIEKAIFDLRNDNAVSVDKILDNCIEFMADMIKVEKPMFSKNSDYTSPVSLIISSGYSGQTTSAEKICGQLEGATLIKVVEQDELENEFADSLMDYEVKRVTSVREIFAQLEALRNSNSKVIIDYSLKNSDLFDLKKLKNGLFNYRDNVEVILSLSSIHSEEYNRKEVGKFKNYINGIIFNYLDACSNFSSIFNLNVDTKIPLFAFGTGQTVPTDLEEATVERVLGGIIEL